MAVLRVIFWVSKVEITQNKLLENGKPMVIEKAS